DRTDAAATAAGMGTLQAATRGYRVVRDAVRDACRAYDTLYGAFCTRGGAPRPRWRRRARADHFFGRRLRVTGGVCRPGVGCGPSGALALAFLAVVGAGLSSASSAAPDAAAALPFFAGVTADFS